jgi:hypothetical protein
MISHFLVCPMADSLINELRGESVVIRLTNLDDLPSTVDAVKRSDAHLHCLMVKASAPLSALSFKEEWKDIPIALYVSSMGNFPEFIKQLPILRQLTIRIYLPTHPQENNTAIRIISSLGIDTAIVFHNDGLDWEQLSDLMAYAYFAQAPHASIAPFDYMTTRYHRNQRNDFNAVYFDDPRTYLHLDKKGRVALTRAHLLAEKFIAQSMEQLGDIEQNEDYIDYLESWRSFFLQTDGCAYCPGWRLCLGKFSHTSPYDTGCKDFFTEFMNLVEQKQSMKNKIKQLWQP